MRLKLNSNARLSHSKHVKLKCQGIFSGITVLQSVWHFIFDWFKGVYLADKISLSICHIASLWISVITIIAFNFLENAMFTK